MRRKSKKVAKLKSRLRIIFKGQIQTATKWNQFEAEIEAAEIPIVTKFSHLKELLETNVRSCIDGLPMTFEGYECAKAILKPGKYWNTSEIVNPYIQNILLLPRAQGSNPAKIHDFYEKLLWNTQSLETLGK
jgi:hypothetical protein